MGNPAEFFLVTFTTKDGTEHIAKNKDGQLLLYDDEKNVFEGIVDLRTIHHANVDTVGFKSVTLILNTTGKKIQRVDDVRIEETTKTNA